MIKSELGQVKLSVPNGDKFGTAIQEVELFADMTCIIQPIDEVFGTDATIRIIEEALKVVYGESEDNK